MSRVNMRAKALFLSDKDSDWNQVREAVEKAAPRRNIDIKRVILSPQVRKALVPQSIETSQSSTYMILFKDERELFICPVGSTLNESIEAYVDRLLEDIMGRKDKAWSALFGYKNLHERQVNYKPLGLQRTYSDLPRQVVNLNRSILKIVEEYEKEAFDLKITSSSRINVENESVLNRTRGLFQRSSASVEQLRQDTIYESLYATSSGEVVEIINDFDTNLVKKNLHLLEQVDYVTCPEKYKKYLNLDILDQESKKFLESAAKVSEFANHHQLHNFDFALPASGLWKLVEREVNASIVWLLRCKYKIAGKHSPWKIKSGGLEVELPERDLKNLRKMEADAPEEFKSVMLGWIRTHVNEGYENGLLDELKSVNESLVSFVIGPHDRRQTDEGTLPFLLKQVQFFRNRHAHIKSMDSQTFEQFEELLFNPYNNQQEANLSRLLSAKEKIVGYIKNYFS